VFISTIS